jgi:hypothetical protein
LPRFTRDRDQPRGDAKAVEVCARRSVNDYGVKYSTVVKDSDLAKLRDSPLFDQVSDELKGASTEAQLIRIRTEAKVRHRGFCFPRRRR